MLSEANNEIEKSIPQLNQVPSNTYYVYNYMPIPQDLLNQPPSFQIRNSSEQFPSLLKQNDSLQLSNLHQERSIPSFQFGQSTPFINADGFMRTVQQHNNSFAQYIMSSQLNRNTLPTKNRIIEGTQILCDIEIVLISRYFDMKQSVFCPPNNKYTLKDDPNISNAEWLKDRVFYRYKKSVRESFIDMIDVLEREGQQNINIMTHAFKFQQSGFDSVERLVPKSVKEKSPFSEFIFEIQQLIGQFLFNIY